MIINTGYEHCSFYSYKSCCALWSDFYRNINPTSQMKMSFVVHYLCQALKASLLSVKIWSPTDEKSVCRTSVLWPAMARWQMVESSISASSPVHRSTPALLSAYSDATNSCVSHHSTVRTRREHFQTIDTFHIHLYTPRV